MAAPNPFQKATKRQLSARVALEGPTGSGKTWSGLEWATVLADGGRTAVIDTERGSAALYSDRFDFDVLTIEPPYEPQRLIEALKAAEANGYAAVMIDSLSHFWEGEGGTLDIVDGAAQRSGGNQFAGWKVGTPALRHLVDTLLGLDAHVIATMRSKMEYVLEEDSRGKKVPRKVGMAPVMRAGVEYEFTLVGDLDLEHRLVISKSRCDALADEVIQPGRAAEAAKRFLSWLSDGEPLASRTDTDALVAQMNEVADEDLRTSIKKGFVERFGKPDQLLQSRLEEARLWVAEKVDPGPDTDPAGAPVPSGPETSGPDGRGVAADTSRETERGAGPDHEPGHATEGVQQPAPASATPNDVSAPGEGGEAAGAGAPQPLGGGDTAPAADNPKPGRKAKTSGGGGADGATSTPSTTPSGAAHKQSAAQKALHARLAEKYKQRDRQDQARHALIGHVTGGRTESSSDATGDDLVAALRLVDDIDGGRSDMELHLNANGAVVLRKKVLRGAA